MKKHMRSFGAILTAGIMVMSVASVTKASDIIIAEDTNIDIRQGTDKKVKEKNEEKIEKNSGEKLEDNDYINEVTSEVENLDDNDLFHEKKSEDDDYINESITEAEKTADDLSDVNGQKDDVVTEDNDSSYEQSNDVLFETEEKDEDLTSEMKLEDEDLTSETKSEDAYSEDKTDVPTNTETSEMQSDENISEESDSSSGTSVNIDNTNYVEINNNTGTVYVNIYNGIGVDIQNKDDQEADVNVLADTEIAVFGDETPVETIETTETTTIEETTEITTESSSKSRRSSSGKRSSGGRSAVLNKPDDSNGMVKGESVVEDEPQKEKRVVAMTIGSRLMNVNGEVIETDSEPYISDGYTLCPLRCISVVFGAEVEWDKVTKTAIIRTDDTQTCFTINSDTMLVNGKTIPIPKSAEIKNGRTYVPLRALGESLGADVSWIPDSKSILIIK